MNQRQFPICSILLIVVERYPNYPTVTLCCIFYWKLPNSEFTFLTINVNRNYFINCLSVFKYLIKERVLWFLIKSQGKSTVTQMIHVLRQFCCVNKISSVKRNFFFLFDHVKTKHENIKKSRKPSRIFGPELNVLVLLKITFDELIWSLNSGKFIWGWFIIIVLLMLILALFFINIFFRGFFKLRGFKFFMWRFILIELSSWN